MLSRRYIEDVDVNVNNLHVEVQYEGMIHRRSRPNINVLSVKSGNLKAQTIITHSHELLINHWDHCIVMLMASLSLLLPHSYTHA